MTKRKPAADLARRASDETTLAWIRLRLEGWTYKRISAAYGIRHTSIAKAVAKVRDADAAESGEDVRGWYA